MNFCKRNAKTKYLILFFVLLTNASLFAASVSDSTKPLRLFLIGNSFSQNASTYLPQLAKEGGFGLVIGRAELGGCPLNRHWELAELNNRDSSDPKGKPYGGKSLRQLLSNGTWDVVTLQQYSMYSSNVDTYEPYAKNLAALIHALQPNAKVVIHQTWAYRTDSKDFGQTGDSTFAGSSKEMWEKSRKAYQAMAKDIQAEIIPVGDAFWMVSSDKKFAFRKDPQFKEKEAVYPALPHEENSLHVGYAWSNDKKLNFDSHHANQAGCYLGGLVWYRFLFGADSTQVRFKPEKVSDEFATFLRSTAARLAIPAKKEASTVLTR